MKLKEIESYFATHEPKDNIRLDEVTVVTDGNLFVTNSIATIKRNEGNEKFKPYFDRLLKYYQIAKENR